MRKVGRLQRFSLFVLFAACWSSCLPVALCKTAAKKEDDKSRYDNLCGSAYPKMTAQGRRKFERIRKISNMASLQLKTAPQHIAMCWAVHKDTGSSSSASVVTQRYVLATLYYSTKPEKWAVSDGWVGKESVCNWYGVTCDRWGSNVVGLDLGFNKVEGILVREIGWLTSLQELRLTANDLQGVIPNSIGQLKNLQVLQLNMNGFFGQIPTELAKLTNLRELHLYGNYFDGKIPTELGSLMNLEIFDMYANFLKGSIPKELAKMKKLKSISLNDNALVGKVPDEVCKLKLENFVTDCREEVQCKCCTQCCKDGADPKCIDNRSVATTKRK